MVQGQKKIRLIVLSSFLCIFAEYFELNETV